MTQLVIWVGLCWMSTLFFARRLAAVLVIALLLRLFVPSTAGFVLTGDWDGNAAIHPSSILLGFALLSGALAYRAQASAELRSMPGAYFLLVLITIAFVIVTAAQRGPNPLLGMSNAFVFPLVFFFLVRLMIRVDPAFAVVITRVFLIACLIQVPIVLGQWLTHSWVVWTFAREIPFSRAVGTLDTPLDLGLVLAVAIPLFAMIRRPVLRYGGASLLLGAIAISQSRTATIVGCLALVWLALWAAKSTIERLVALGAIAFGVAQFLSSDASAGLIERLTGDDGSSSSVRAQAFSYALEHWPDALVAGGGWGSAYLLKGTVLRSSLESGYVILAFDLGVIFTLVLIGVQIRAIAKVGSPAVGGARIAAASALILSSLYSGTLTMSAASLILWLALSLSSGDKFKNAIPDDLGDHLRGFRRSRNSIDSYERLPRRTWVPQR